MDLISVAVSRSGQAHRRCSGDSGLALVEGALIMPILLMLLLGSLDLAFTYRDQLTVTNSAADGAKFGAIMGKGLTPAGETGDFVIMKEIRASLGSVNPNQIDRIVIFKGNSSSYGSPMAQFNATGCKTASASVAGRCNVYFPRVAFPQIVSGNADYFKCVSSGDPACGWNPTSRIDGPTTADIQYLGVYIRYKHSNFSPYLGASRDIEVAKVVRLEPGLQI